MKPRVTSRDWTGMVTGRRIQRWHVQFEDSCGCPEEEDYPTFHTALRFALHVAGGGSRWEFVE